MPKQISFVEEVKNRLKQVEVTLTGDSLLLARAIVELHDLINTDLVDLDARVDQVERGIDEVTGRLDNANFTI